MTRHHNPSPVRPGPAHRGPSSSAQARCHTRRAKPSPAALHPYSSLPPPRVVEDGLTPGQTTPPVPGGGHRGPGAAILELSFRSRLPTRAQQSLQKPNPAGPALTCHAATAAAASILGLSSSFLTESASTAPRALAIGSGGLSPLFLLD